MVPLLGLLVVLILFSVIWILVWIRIWIGKKFAGVAVSKGYEEEPWKSACIIFGMPAWLLVIALPNKKYHQEY
jgi:ABC-type Fe3+ transport system permease subunit